MRNNFNRKQLACALLTGLASSTALAGGPLFLAEGTHKPLHWDVSQHPVPVYTDVGDLCDTRVLDEWAEWTRGGCLSREQTDAAVAHGFAQWSSVPTSSFRAEIKGDFSAIGLGDVTGANAAEIVGKWNGGGYHVMYDADSSIIQDFFGAPEGVLGISSPEWTDGGELGANGAPGEIITESWAVFTPASVPKDDPYTDENEADDGTRAGGVMTHEFGHGINLAHSQTNGHITFFGAPWYWIPWAPQQCKAPYDVNPFGDFSTQEQWDAYDAWIVDTMIPATETMYPFISPEHTGEAVSTVDRPDDMAAVSDIYPAPGWPQNRGTISGEILQRDGATGLSGVNVVARNVDDPINDSITVMSGDHTQGSIGPDGRYTINGLKPGAKYVVYVENIIAGGFPTQPATLPSFQEYWNGASESANAATDDPCGWSTITATAAAPASASIAFNGIPRAPQYLQLPVPYALDLDNGGRNVVGSYAGLVSWRYDTVAEKFDVIESVAYPKLARDGRTMTALTVPEAPPWEGGMFEPALWSPQTGLQLLTGMPANEPGCDGYTFVPYDLSETGRTVVGLGYRNGCPRGSWSDEGPNRYWAAAWNASTGLKYLTMPDLVLEDQANCQWDRETGCTVDGARANAISGDGRTIVGHAVTGDGMWRGAAWIDRRFVMMGADDPKGWIGSADAVNRDGTVVTGGGAGSAETGMAYDAYLWSLGKGTTNLGHFSFPCEEVAPWVCEFQPTVDLPTKGTVVSDKGDIVLGDGMDFWNQVYRDFIWIKGLGMIEFTEFLKNQGVMEAWQSPLQFAAAMTPNGKTIVGTAGNGTSFLLELDQVWVCQGNKSLLVGYPGAMVGKVTHGAELGLCAKDRPIEP